MTKKSRRPQKSKREQQRGWIFSGNTKKRYLREKRLLSKGGNNFRHAGCPGCEYCDNLKRNMKLRRGFPDDWQYEYC